MKKDNDCPMDFFKTLIDNDLTPNQFYVLLCLYKESNPKCVNVHTELRGLANKKTWLTKEKQLTPKAIDFIKVFTGLEKDKPKKAAEKPSSNPAEIIFYNELFPNIKLPSGKAARSDKRNVQENFKWFFQNHSYSWETIFKATEMYIEEYRLKNWNYMRNSMYFIRKQDQDKSFKSDLADYCAIVESGGSFEQEHIFPEEVK